MPCVHGTLVITDWNQYGTADRLTIAHTWILLIYVPAIAPLELTPKQVKLCTAYKPSSRK